MAKVERLDKIYLILFIKKYILVMQNIYKLDIEDGMGFSILNFNDFSWESVLDNLFPFFKIFRISGYNGLDS